MTGKIAVSAAVFAIDKPYSYRIPEEMTLLPGMRVQVPFGRGNKLCDGIVLSVETGEEAGLKAVCCALDDAPVLTPTQLKLASFLRERYFCTFFDAARAMLPADAGWKTAVIRKAGAKEILLLLEALGAEAEETKLHEAVADDEAFSAALAYLLKKKWISTTQEFHPRVTEKNEKIAALAVPGEQAMAFAAQRPKSAAMQRSVLELLAALGSGAVKDICYYTGASPATLRRLEELGYVELSERPVLRCREIQPAEVERPLVLSEEQQDAFLGLRQQMEQPRPGVALLYGITGSGKTSVYIRLIQHCLDAGKTALLLVPEIALTPQLLGVMAAWFGSQVAILHSSLGMGERYDQWKRIKSGDARVIVGTRSAVFAPTENLGVIILDEEQEHSYKSENNPRYSAKEVAIWRGLKEHTLVLLGSATPSVESMYHAKRGDYTLYTLKNRYNGRPLPQVEIVDMREEVKLGNDMSLSLPLRQEIYDNWNAGNQTVLLLNRRGNSRALVCVDCREVPQCPRCAQPMTYHSANNRLMCHYCGHSQPAPDTCPDCGGAMKHIGFGTQKVEEELTRLFPGTELLRMDADTTAGGHEEILQTFERERVPILLGTQMVAKGLDFENVTLVGVLSADISLYVDNYRAAERTFSLLTQVVGRAGRGGKTGRAVIQTYTPGNDVIRCAARQDYDAFYESEIRMRRLRRYPPFADLFTVTVSGTEEGRVLRAAVSVRETLRQLCRRPELAAGEPEVLGPAPAPVVKVNNRFRYRCTLVGKNDKATREMLAWLQKDFAKDSANRGMNLFVDHNAAD